MSQMAIFLCWRFQRWKSRHFSSRNQKQQVPGTCECEAGWGGPVSWHPQHWEPGAPEKPAWRTFFFCKLHRSFLLFFFVNRESFFFVYGVGGIFCEFFFFGGGECRFVSSYFWNNLRWNFGGNQFEFQPGLQGQRHCRRHFFNDVRGVDSSLSSNRCVMCFVTP